MSDFEDKIRRGQLPHELDWESHLIEVHDRDVHFTPKAFAGFRTSEGHDSYEILADVLPNSAGDLHMLDLACGDGHLVPALMARLGSTARVTGVDIAPEALEFARRQYAGDKRVEFIEARAQALPLADQSVDAVLSHMALMLISPLEPALAEIRRVLKPGGVFAAVFSSGKTHGLYKEIQRLCGIFLEAHASRYLEARRSKGMRWTVEGIVEKLAGDFTAIEIDEFHIRYHVPAEGIWRYLEGMYFLPLMPEEAQRELHDDLMSLARDHLDGEQKVAFDVPIKRFKARRL